MNQVKQIAESLYANHGATLKREDIGKKVVFGAWYKRTDCERLTAMIWLAYSQINSFAVKSKHGNISRQ